MEIRLTSLSSSVIKGVKVDLSLNILFYDIKYQQHSPVYNLTNMWVRFFRMTEARRFGGNDAERDSAHAPDDKLENRT